MKSSIDDSLILEMIEKLKREATGYRNLAELEVPTHKEWGKEALLYAKEIDDLLARVNKAHPIMAKIQKLEEKIMSLESTIADLESTVSSLETDIDNLEDDLDKLEPIG